MDGLALLCNLFADGPVTLERLRAARLTTLAALDGVTGERLAACLHASVPQARAFADEARKLARRLAEVGAEEPRVADEVLRPVARPASTVSVGARLVAETPGGAVLLRPGLLPGLDEALCACLQRHRVRTVQALGEFAGLELARRTGIPYSKLLELGRQARRFAAPPPLRAEPVAALQRQEPCSSGPFV